MRYALTALIFTLSFFNQPSAEAEDLLAANPHHGPRAGFMRGTGSVQSELLFGPGPNIRLYFVDANWIDLPLEKSSIKATLTSASVPARELTCAIKGESYRCGIPTSGAFLMGDRLKIDFTAADGSSASFFYTFPFQGTEEAPPVDSSAGKEESSASAGANESQGSTASKEAVPSGSLASEHQTSH